MAWELSGTPKTVKVTTKLAKEWADMEAVHIDRPLSERRLQVYEKMVRAGGFRPVTWARAYCKETDQMLRVNGKHTSTLFANLPPELLTNLYVVIEEYEADALGDVANLYATFDSKTMTRTASDIYASFAATIPELAELDRRTIGLLVGALDYASNPSVNYGGSQHGTAIKTTAEKAEELFDNVDVCQWLTSVLPGGTHTNAHMFRVPVAAAMVNTWRRSRSAATEFWLAVLNETGTSPNLPDRKLAKWLTQNRVSIGGRASTPQRFKTGPKEFYVRCIHAWNAWRKNETTNLNYYPTKPVPSAK